MDEKNLKEFENTLAPEIARFAPKKNSGPSISSLIEAIRVQAQQVLGACDQMDELIAASEADAKVAFDNLLNMIKRVK